MVPVKAAPKISVQVLHHIEVLILSVLKIPLLLL